MPCCGQQAMGLLSTFLLCQFTLFLSYLLFLSRGITTSLLDIDWNIYWAHSFASLMYTNWWISNQKQSSTLYKRSAFVSQSVCAGAFGFIIVVVDGFAVGLFLFLNLFVTFWKRCTRYGIIVNMKGCVKGPARFRRLCLKINQSFLVLRFFSFVPSHTLHGTQSRRNAACSPNARSRGQSVESTCRISICQCFAGSILVHLHKGKVSTAEGTLGNRKLPVQVAHSGPLLQAPWTPADPRPEKQSHPGCFVCVQLTVFICIIYCFSFVWSIYQIFPGVKAERQWGLGFLWMSMVGVEGARDRWRTSVLWCCGAHWETSGCMLDSPALRSTHGLYCMCIPHTGLYFRKTSAINPSICASMTFHLCACETVCVHGSRRNANTWLVRLELQNVSETNHDGRRSFPPCVDGLLCPDSVVLIACLCSFCHTKATSSASAHNCLIPHDAKLELFSLLQMNMGILWRVQIAILI